MAVVLTQQQQGTLAHTLVHLIVFMAGQEGCRSILPQLIGQKIVEQGAFSFLDGALVAAICPAHFAKIRLQCLVTSFKATGRAAALAAKPSIPGAGRAHVPQLCALYPGFWFGMEGIPRAGSDVELPDGQGIPSILVPFWKRLKSTFPIPASLNPWRLSGTGTPAALGCAYNRESAGWGRGQRRQPCVCRQWSPASSRCWKSGSQR